MSLVKNAFRKPARPNRDVPLFDNTRNMSLYQLRASGMVDHRQEQVLEAMQGIAEDLAAKGAPEGCSAREIAEYLHWPINCITGRIAELRDIRLLIEECGKKKDISTNRTVKLYRIINPINASRQTSPADE